MIKVVSVISDTNIGGAGKILLSFLKEYNRDKIDMEVVIPKGSALFDELDKLDIKVAQLSHIADQSFSLGGVMEFLKYFKRTKPDIVHTHAVLSARVGARLYGKCKIVHTRHSVFDQPSYKKKFPIKQLSGFLNNRLSDVILAVSPAAKENIVETGTDPNRVKVVFNGINPQTVINGTQILEERKVWGFKETDFVCAIIARLEKVKGHEYLIQAFQTLQEKDPDIKLIIAGTGLYEKELKAMANGCKNICFAGFVKDIYKIENMMDAQLNASYGTEATSISLLEGMSLGKPAIASDFGGNPYVIENGVNGLIVPKKNAEAMVKAIIKLKEDKAYYQKLSDGAKQSFKQKFTLRSMTRKIEQEYDNVLNKRGVAR